MFNYVSFSEAMSEEIERIHGLMSEARANVTRERTKPDPDFDLIHNLHLDIARYQGILEGLNIAGGIAYREVMKPREVGQ